MAKSPQFRPDDPLHDLHVPRSKRQDFDGGEGSDALEGGADDDFDRQAIKQLPVVDEADLQ